MSTHPVYWVILLYGSVQVTGHERMHRLRHCQTCSCYDTALVLTVGHLSEELGRLFRVNACVRSPSASAFFLASSRFTREVRSSVALSNVMNGPFVRVHGFAE
jgi:hypothetical protein